MRKTQLLVLVLIGSLCTFASAQSTTQPATPPVGGGIGGGGAGGGQGRGEMLFQRIHDQLSDLNLTDDQSKKIDDILDKAKSDFQALLPQMRDMQPQERQQKLRDIMMGTRDKIKDVLTPDQQQKFAQKMDALRQQRPGGRFGGQGNGAGNATNSATTLPSNSQPQPGQRIEAMMQRLQESLAALNLNADQKSQADKIVQDTKAQLDDLRTKARGGGTNPDEMRSQAQDILSSTRDQLAGILTKDQQEQLRDEIQTRVNESGATSRPSTQPVAMTDPTMQDQDKMQSDAMKDGASAQSGTASSDNSKNNNASKSAFLSAVGPKVGDPAPTFSLTNINGRPVQLSYFKGKALVIEFGSYTSPSFRDHAAKMEEFARQNSGRANFLIVYTKEAHPKGGWDVDRNKEDRISLAQAADMKARLDNATEARTALKITIPMAIDSMDNATATAFGAGENSAVIIGKDGSVAAKETWCDPYRLKIALDEVIMGNSVATAR